MRRRFDRRAIGCGLAALVATAQGFGVSAATSAHVPVVAAAYQPGGRSEATPHRASFSGALASSDVRRVADWVVASSDNGGLPFVIVDKVDAKVFVFDGHGQLRGAAPALVGLARGDDNVAGVGDLPLSAIGPKDRITPAGRFVASLGRDLSPKDVLWVDYKSGLSLHRVITTNPKEHRLQRLAAASPLQHRISYGCINVPADFYDKVVDPAFAGTSGIVYILPETRPIQDVFAVQ